MSMAPALDSGSRREVSRRVWKITPSKAAKKTSVARIRGTTLTEFAANKQYTVRARRAERRPIHRNRPFIVSSSGVRRVLVDFPSPQALGFQHAQSIPA